MRKAVGLLMVIPCALLLTACGKSPETPVVEKAAPASHVWQGQVDALEKAKAVDGVIQSSAEQQRQQLEQSSGAAE